jgi:hypothetical protein
MYCQVYDVSDLLQGQADVGEFANSLADELAAVQPRAKWDDGAVETLHRFGGMFVVSQTFDAHRRIEQTLAALRRLTIHLAAGEFAPLPAIADDPDNVATNAELDKPCELDVSAISLATFAERIAKQQGINVVVDRKALEDAGISSTDTEVSVTSHKDSARHCLRIALKQLELTFIVQHGVVLITMPECFQDIRSVYYPVADLAALADGNSPAESNGYKAVADIIRSSIVPSSWSTVGGESEIHNLPTFGSLRIDAPEEIHPQIVELLTQLRHKAQASQAAAPDAGEIVTRTYTLPASIDPQLHAASASAIAQIIRDTITPDSWKTGDVKQAYLGVLPDRIVVRAKRSVHHEIRGLLRTIEHADKSGHR